MKKYTLFFLTILFAFSCTTDDGIESNLSGEISLTFTTNSRVELIENPEIEFSSANIVDGDQLVFKFERIDGFDNELVDDEIVEFIVFEVAPNSVSFSYSNDDFIDTNTYHNVSCFCSSIGAVQTITGTIEGIKLKNNLWSVSIDVTIDRGNFSKPIIVEGIYSLENN